MAGNVACWVRKPERHAISVKEAFQIAEAKVGTLGSVGWYQSPKLGGDYRGGTIGASPAYSFTAHVAEVACDVETGRVQVDTTLVSEVETSGGIELLGERAGGTFITATGNVLVPVERGLVGLFAEGRWNHANRLFVTGGIRVERITREPLAGDADAFAPRPPFDSDTVVSPNPKVSAAWFVRANDGNYTKVRGSAGTGIRPPDAFEIAFTDNPSLKPERSRTFDIGVD